VSRPGFQWLVSARQKKKKNIVAGSGVRRVVRPSGPHYETFSASAVSAFLYDDSLGAFSAGCGWLGFVSGKGIGGGEGVVLLAAAREKFVKLSVAGPNALPTKPAICLINRK